MTLQTVRVADKRLETDDIAVFVLKSSGGGALPPFEPGSHIDVHLAPELIRQYSLCNAPDIRDYYEIAVLREANSRGGSVAMHDLVSIGDMIEIGLPRNAFRLEPTGRSLMFAGGIGVTPLLAMAEALSAKGRDFQMHYCSRSAPRTAFLPRIASAAFASQVTHYFDDEPNLRYFNVQDILSAEDKDTHLYVCGPRGYIDHVVSAAHDLNWLPNHIHVEHFGEMEHVRPQDCDFEVEIASSGKRIHVPSTKTVAAALKENGVPIALSCQSGVCGTCLTGVIAGECDHRDTFLTPAEQALNNQFTPCCSRAKSAVLVIDL